METETEVKAWVKEAREHIKQFGIFCEAIEYFSEHEIVIPRAAKDELNRMRKALDSLEKKL
jgi:hypothetical protein